MTVSVAFNIEMPNEPYVDDFSNGDVHASTYIGHKFVSVSVDADGWVISVLSEADILCLAVPETPGTKNLISRKRLDLLKPSCGIVNIGRQSAVDYDALCEKLITNKIAGAILDVFTPEPIELNSKLWEIPNLIITPHVSADDGESYVKLTLDLFIKNLQLFISNKKLVNQIDKNFSY